MKVTFLTYDVNREKEGSSPKILPFSGRDSGTPKRVAPSLFLSLALSLALPLPPFLASATPDLVSLASGQPQKMPNSTKTIGGTGLSRWRINCRGPKTLELIELRMPRTEHTTLVWQNDCPSKRPSVARTEHLHFGVFTLTKVRSLPSLRSNSGKGSTEDAALEKSV